MCQRCSHRAFTASWKHKMYWLYWCMVFFLTRKKTDICGIHTVTSSLSMSSLFKTPHILKHTLGGDSDWETASKLGEISFKLCLAVEMSSSNLFSHMNLLKHSQKVLKCCFCCIHSTLTRFSGTFTGKLRGNLTTAFQGGSHVTAFWGGFTSVLDKKKPNFQEGGIYFVEYYSWE